MSSTPEMNPSMSSVPDRHQAAWYIVALATMSFVLAIFLMLTISSALAHHYVYAGLMLVVGPPLLLAIIVNARRILRAIP